MCMPPLTPPQLAPAPSLPHCQALSRWLLDQFHAQTGVQVEDDGDTLEGWRALRRLRTEAKAIKEKLSANSAIPLKIEGLHQKRDLEVTITRWCLAWQGAYLAP